MKTYTVPVSLKDEIKKRLEKLSKKAAAYGSRLDWSFGAEKIVSRDVFTVSGNHCEKTGSENIFGIEVNIDADMIRKDGYTVIAGIDHDPAGNIVTMFDDSAGSDAAWYTMPAYCEHCGTRHAKRYTFIVKDAAGNCKQVGKTCLKDYCGIDPAAVAMSANIADLFLQVNDFDDPDFSGSGDYAYDVITVIAAAADLIDQYGYVKSSERNSTKDRLLSDLGRYDPTQKSIALAEKIREFFSGLDYADLTDYQRNLKSILNAGYARANSFGYLAYAPIAYRQMIEKMDRDQARKDAAADSVFIGSVGNRITCAVKESKLMTSWQTAYGMTYLYRFVTPDGNIVIWFASKPISGSPVTVTGTVKEHKEYNGEKQTIVTRCKVN